MNKSGIDTCDYSFSPVKGCNNHGCFLHPAHKGEGPGAGKCWAAAMCNRMAGPWAKSEYEYVRSQDDTSMGNVIGSQFYYDCLKKFKPTLLESIFSQPFPKKASRIAVLYMTDFAFIPREWVQRVIDKINKDNQERKAAGLPLHQFQWLTKKPQAYSNFQWPDNCQLGFTATDQAEFDERLNGLLTYRYNFNYRLYIYLEPLRGAIDINRMVSRLDWVIVGGGDMPVNPSWVRKIRNDCIEDKISLFFKSWGKYVHLMQMPRCLTYDQKIAAIKKKKPEIEGGYYRIGKMYTGCEIDGQQWKQFPEVNNG